jgi:hypothetical protein
MRRNLFCLFGFHQWHYLLSEVGYIPLSGWPKGTTCLKCGVPHPKPLGLDVDDDVSEPTEEW